MKKYETPEILVVVFSTADVITASGDVAYDDSQWTDFY